MGDSLAEVVRTEGALGVFMTKSSSGILREILFFWEMRGAGNTYAMVHGALNASVPPIVVAKDALHAAYFRNCGLRDVITVYQIPEALRGIHNRPLLVDHYVMAQLISEAMKEQYQAGANSEKKPKTKKPKKHPTNKTERAS